MLWFVLFLLSTQAPLLAAADTPPPVPGPDDVLLGPNANVNDFAFDVYSSISGKAFKDYWCPSTGKVYGVQGIQGYKAHTKDATIADITVTDEKTGDYGMKLKRPGVTSVFFTDEKSGKVPRYGVLGEMITVTDPTELPILQNQPVDIIAERNFLDALPGEMLRLKGIFRQELAGNFTLNFTVRRPDDWIGTFSKNVFGNKFAPSTNAVLYEEGLGEAPQKGQYNIEVRLINTSRRTIAISRFDVWIGEYGFAGRIGSPVIDEAELWVLYEDFAPDAFAVYGRFPKRADGGARLYLDNRLISSKLKLYRRDVLIFDVQGTKEKFPAMRQRLVVFFEDVGYSLVFNYDNPVDPQQVEPLKLTPLSAKSAKGANVDGADERVVRAILDKAARRSALKGIAVGEQRQSRESMRATTR